MTAISTDRSWGAIYDLQVEEIPVSTHGTAVTAVPKRVAIVHGHVDSKTQEDTLDLNTYSNGTINKVRGMAYEACGGTDCSGSTEWSGTSLTLVGHSGSPKTTALYDFGAIIEMK